MNELISIQSSFFHQRVSPLLTRLLICGRSNEERKHMLPSCEEYRYQNLEEERSNISLLQSHCDHCHRLLRFARILFLGFVVFVLITQRNYHRLNLLFHKSHIHVQQSTSLVGIGIDNVSFKEHKSQEGGAKAK